MWNNLNPKEAKRSHSARSAWIETFLSFSVSFVVRSHSARSAWIETCGRLLHNRKWLVALRKECVD